MALLTGDLATIIGSAANFLMLDGTLRREVSASVDSYGDPVVASPTTYTFRGFEDNYDAAYRARAGIPSTDSKILILATSLDTTPQIDDRLQIRSQWYKARAVMTDPARATWEVQVYKVDAP